MSLQERELRDRLDGLLHGIEPRPAPVADTMRRGRALRLHRWISAAAGATILVAGAIVLPGLVSSRPPASSAPAGHHVTVSPVGVRAPAGLIAQGATDGHRWTAVMSAAGRHGVMLTGRGLPGFASFQSESSQFTPRPAALTTTGSGSLVLEFGTVRADVSRVIVSLSDGENVTLTPVSWNGRRWVAVLLPSRLPIVRAVLYTSRGELAYAVPFRGFQLVVWWSPGQPGLARLTKVVGSGVVDGRPWRATAYLGPWGYCYSVAASSSCIESTADPAHVPAGTLVSPIGCYSLQPRSASKSARVGLAAVAPAVRLVVLRYSGGSTATLPAVAVGRDRMIGYVIPGGSTVVSSHEYGIGGRVLGTTSGAAWTC